MDPDRLARHQVGGVRRRVEPLARPAPRGEPEGGSAVDPQPRAVRAAEPRPPHVRPRAVLLRTYVRGLHRVHGHGVPADARRGPGVRVRLARPAAEPLRLAQLPWYVEVHPEPGQGARPVALRRHRHRQGQPFAVRRPAVLHAEPEAARGRCEPCPYDQRVAPDPHLVHPVAHPVQADPPPQRPVPHLALPGCALVVVGRRAPHIEPGTLDAEAAQRAERTGGGVEDAGAQHEGRPLAGSRRGAARPFPFGFAARQRACRVG